MELAYVDTSVFVAIAFDEPGSAELAETLESYETLVSSNLLEAELRASLVREGLEEGHAEVLDRFLARLTWILPNRPLTSEMGHALEHGYQKGADLWHLACAVFLEPRPKDLFFATLDHRQARTAAALGFPVLPVREGE